MNSRVITVSLRILPESINEHERKTTFYRTNGEKKFTSPVKNVKNYFLPDKERKLLHCSDKRDSAEAYSVKKTK